MMKFINKNSYPGFMLLLCTFCSILLANVFKSYPSFWDTEIPFAHSLHLPSHFLHLLNDGFMAIFFFAAGLEIKQEILSGGLSSFKKAFLPIAAAIGGMVVPALIFLIFNNKTPYAGGWAIPVATDIAFALGIGSLAGKAFTPQMKIFLTALAIIDDLGAILIIALFYGGQIHIIWLAAAIGTIGLFFVLSFYKVKKLPLYIILSILLWYCLFNSGIHATIAGVVAAFFIPAGSIKQVQLALQKPVNFIIVPLFALANTAIVLPPNIDALWSSTLMYGVVAGLFLGKPLGVFLVTMGLHKTKISTLPHGLNGKHILGIGLLAGIGFTMSLFISVLSFTKVEVQENAKLAVLLAAVCSIIVSFVYLNSIKGRNKLGV